MCLKFIFAINYKEQKYFTLFLFSDLRIRELVKNFNGLLILFSFFLISNYFIEINDFL